MLIQAPFLYVCLKKAHVVLLITSAWMSNLLSKYFNSPPVKPSKQAIFSTVWLVGILLISLTIYQYGWSGGWHFDDAANLGNLTYVFTDGHLNTDAALQFVFSGEAGPSGRPLSLLSFLIDGSSWPQNAASLLYTNSMLHLLNAMLLCATLLQIGKLQKLPALYSQRLALALTTLWLLSPLLASTSLISIQRMTLLSSSFMLLGLLLYMLGRMLLENSFRLGLLVMATGLASCSVLGGLAKEQAVILPLLAWTVEAFLLPKIAFKNNLQKKIWLQYKILIFYFPTLIILLFLSHIVIKSDSSYATRDFNLVERLLTQSVILWDYLRLTFFPRALAFGPFHDDYPIYGFGWQAMLAISVWIAASVACWKARKHSKLPLFALIWYWAAHLIESTVVPLELYFEHRNYLAIIGPLYAVVYGAWYLLLKKQARSAYIVFAIYTILTATVLLQTTSLNGQRDVAAELWAIEHPNSLRATQHLAQFMIVSNDPQTALRVLDGGGQNINNSAELQIQAFQLACEMNLSQKNLEERLKRLLHDLPLDAKGYSTTGTLQTLQLLSQNDICPEALNTQILIQIGNAVLKNPRITSHSKELSNIYVLMGLLYADQRKLDLTISHLVMALKIRPRLQTHQLAVAFLNSAGRPDIAADLLNEYPIAMPTNPLLRKQLEKEWKNLHDQVERLKTDTGKL